MLTVPRLPIGTTFEVIERHLGILEHLAAENTQINAKKMRK